MGMRASRGVGYSRAERVSDAAIHCVGLTAALLAVPVLVTLAAVWHGDVTVVAATLVYGVTLIAMLFCSALYHMTHDPSWKPTLLWLDHSAIYFKIAGTYTPFTLIGGGHGVYLLTGLWGIALAGTSLKFVAPDRYKMLAVGLYLAMGWAGFVAGQQVLSGLSTPALSLVVVGGLIYTFGVIFFLWEMLPFHNTIWHGFVLTASVVFYAAVLVHLADAPALAAAN